VSLLKARKITVSQVLGFGKLNVTEIKEKISAISQPPNDASIGKPTNSGKGSLTGSESKLSHLRQLNMKKSLDSLGNSEVCCFLN
jgi:hypothetical protein